MFNLFRRDTPSQSAPQIVERIIYRDNPGDDNMRAAHNDYIERANSEYARLRAAVSYELGRRDRGLSYVESKVDWNLGKMHAIQETLSILTGEDSINTGAYLSNQARDRISNGEEFPLNSYLTGDSLIFGSLI